MKNNRQLWTLSLILALAMFSLSGCNRESGVDAAREADVAANQAGVPAAEQDFMMKVTQANVAEIMFARQAMQKSKNDDVKDFARMIESDHMKALERLAELMNDKSVTQLRVPATEAAQEMDVMHRLSGADFDREFANMMVEKNQKSVELFRDQASTAQNPGVKEYTTDILPTLEMHLQKAQSLQSKLFSLPAR